MWHKCVSRDQECAPCDVWLRGEGLPLIERIQNACMAQIPLQPLFNPGNPWECLDVCVCLTVCAWICASAVALSFPLQRRHCLILGLAMTNVPNCSAACTCLCVDTYIWTCMQFFFVCVWFFRVDNADTWVAVFFFFPKSHFYRKNILLFENINIQ